MVQVSTPYNATVNEKTHHFCKSMNCIFNRSTIELPAFKSQTDCLLHFGATLLYL